MKLNKLCLNTKNFEVNFEVKFPLLFKNIRTCKIHFFRINFLNFWRY